MPNDYIHGLRERQLELSDRFSKDLFAQFEPDIKNGRFSALGGYLRNEMPDTDPSEYDLEAMNALIQSELSTFVYVSVMGYTDWAASRIVGSGNKSVPSTNEVEYSKIEEEFDAPPETLRRTVAFMNAQKALPLLGTINNGSFSPDKQELETWASHYNW